MQISIINDEDFAVVRKSHGYYVDKTGFFEEFLQDPNDPKNFSVPSRVTLFTRPRRFGKTMFMYMLAEFFDIKKDSKELFSGLKVSKNEQLCKEWMNQYPVVFITMKDANQPTFDEFIDSIKEIVKNSYDYYCDDIMNSNKINKYFKKDFEQVIIKNISSNNLKNSIFLLTKVLYTHYEKPVILLIDEYDASIAAAEQYKYYDKMLPFMQSFLGNALKSNPFIKMGILTGVLRLTKQNLFSDINHLECYDSATEAYEDLFGFTQEEVDTLLAHANIMEKRDIIKEWYDGYHIGRRSDMYCPWSVMQYLQALAKSPSVAPKEYWVDTGSNQPTREFAPKKPSGLIQEYLAALLDGRTIPANINTLLNYDRIFLDPDNFWTLLYLTGYLTLSNDRENCVENPGDRSVLGIPNKEVRHVFKSEINALFQDVLPADCRNDFLSKFWQGDAKGLELLLDERMKLSTAIQEYSYKEFFYQTLLKGLFLFQYNISANRQDGDGIFELMVDNGKDIAAVIEIKRADSKSQLDAKVQEALAQIEARSYDEPLRAKKFTKILHWGMAFHKRTCRMGVKIVCHATTSATTSAKTPLKTGHSEIFAMQRSTFGFRPKL